jgi:uncharacterized protein
MNYRKLGSTGLTVSEIGLGTEYLNGQPRETVCAVVREAIAQGVNYFDILYSFTEYRDNMAAAFEGLRDRIIIAGHIGAAETDGQYRRTRDVAECRNLFEDLLARFHTEYVEVVFIQFVDEEEDYQQITGPGGLLELALQLKKEGKAKSIGLSAHSPQIALKAARHSQIDVLMYPRNILMSPVPDQELLDACREHGKGFVAMKPFGGGKIFNQSKITVTPVQCISYVLTEDCVSSTVPGVKDLSQLQASLKYSNASRTEKYFEPLLKDLYQLSLGECMYCNHCQPCPENINIGVMMMLLDSGLAEMSDDLKNQYREQAAKASDCLACGACSERCPLKVDVIEKMKQTAKLFEG